MRAYDTIADRDADGNVQDGDVAAVRDASADPTVDSGSALYQWDESAGAWVKIAEGESTDIVHQWAAIVGGPTAPPAEIDAAAALAHTHPNKPVLDKFAESQQLVPKYNGLEIIRTTPDSIVIYVAPDAGSAQPGDWGEYGGDGILSAYYEMTKYLAAAGKTLDIVARPGDFHFNDPMVFNHPQPVSVRLRAEKPPVLPKIGSYSTSNIDGDQEILRHAYHTRFSYSGWTAIDVAYGATAWIENILWESKAGLRTAIRARNGGQVRAGRVSTINAYAGYYANDASSILAYWGGHHIAERGYVASAIDGSGVNLAGYKDDCIVGLYCNHGFYAVRGSSMIVQNSSSEAVYLRHISGDAINVQNGSQMYSRGIDVFGCRYGAYLSQHSTANARDWKIRENNSLAYTINHSALAVSSWDIPPNGTPDTARRFYAHGSSWNWIDKSNFTGGDMILSPEADMEGNMGAWNRIT